MKTIYKRIWPDMFDGDKELSLDFRLADFELEVGDEIAYQEWDPAIKQYTGREYRKIVKTLVNCESPTRYWTVEELNKHGLYLMEFEP
ncbi:MAG: hypothetical protein WC841_04910 [Candidatus Shapirobacteria bacterium]|jgi:hypothetical protein